MNYATQLLKIISLFFFFFSTTTVAQQDPQYTNYMYNTSVINPAYAGTRESLSISGVYRSQWVGLDGAPVTSTVTAHTPLRNATMGLGLSFINDEIGPAVENSLSVDFSYHIDLGNLSTLAFGVKTTANLLNIDFQYFR